MRPAVSCDFSESARSIDIVFYFTEATREQGGSAAPRAMLIMRGRTAARFLTSSKGLLDPPIALLLHDRGHERQKCRVTFALHVFGRNKMQRGRIHRITLSSWRSLIGHQMS